MSLFREVDKCENFLKNERSEDSYIEFGDILSGKKVLKCSNNYRCSFINTNAFMNALRFICTS